MSKVALDAAGIDRALRKMADDLASRKGDGPWAVVGIRSGGEPIAERLAEHLCSKTGQEPARGTVDVMLYRDDGFGRTDWPEVGVTDIPFDLKSHTVILVDDVLYTGRTVRAALDAILDYGRPRAVRLAVLVDRGLRELPIGADAVGHVLDTSVADHVDVQMKSSGAEADAVILTEGRNPRP